MKHAKRDFPLLFGALTLALSLSACETKSGTDIKKIKDNDPVKKQTPIVAKPLPPLSRGNQAVLLLEELMRAHEASLNLAYEPKQDLQVGCITYDAQRKETEDMRVYLGSTYKCSREVAGNELEPKGLKIALDGKELYGASKKKPLSKMEGKYIRVTNRLTTPVELADEATLSRTIVLKYPQSFDADKYPTFTLNATGIQEDYRPERRNSGEYWVSTITGALKESTGRSLNLEPGATLELNYRPRASGTSAEAMTKLSFRAETAIQFSSGACPRPIGTFSWTFTNSNGKEGDKGLFETSEAGIKDVAAGETHAWPVNCLEK